jgi:DNA polymerase V
MLARVTQLQDVRRSPLFLPFFSSRVPAGFPSPADDHLDGRIDLAAFLIENEPATFLVRACGDSMIGAGIFNNDLLVVDRSAQAVDGSIVVAEVAGEFTLKRLRLIAGIPWLHAENPNYPPQRVTEETGFVVWGVVKHSVRTHGHA